MDYKMKGGKIHDKVKGGAAGGGIALSIVVIFSFIYTRATGEQLPADVLVAIGALLTYLGTIVTAYMVPPSPKDIPVPDPN